METKLSSVKQIALLVKGSILKRFPNYGAPEEVFDHGRGTYIDSFEIRSINQKYQMFELVMTGTSTYLLSSPADVGRIFIKSYDLVNQGIWWQYSNVV